MEAVDQRLAAIGAAAAEVLRDTSYHSARTEVVAAAIKLPGSGGRRGRSAVWLYNEVKSRRVLVALAAFHAWQAFDANATSRQDAPPQTVIAARASLVAALSRVMLFHRAESALMIQVGHGIGDIATTEKSGEAPVTPEWPAESPWGRVADDAWHSRLGIYADFLTPIVRAATRVVTLLPEREVRQGARLLSDLAFRTWLADPDGPVEATADGLAALWFERQLVHAAGPWVRELEGAERAYVAVKRRGTDPRAEAAADSALARVLLNAGTMHRRGTADGERIIEALIAICGWDSGRPTTAARIDLEALTDATSRHALAALRFGDLDTARRSWELSRDVAERGLDGDEYRTVRGDSNLAVVMSMCGRPLTAFEQIDRVMRTRLRLAESSGAESTWRRCTVTHNDLVMVAYRAGRAVEAVRLATAMLADRETHGVPENVNIAEARLTLGRALLAAGHPVEARGLVEGAHRLQRARFVGTGFRLQDNVVCLARIALVLDDPGGALSLLNDAAAGTDWFAENVSFRLAYQARRLRSIALAGLGDGRQALRLLNDDLRRLGQLLPPNEPDPLLLDYSHAIAGTLLGIGDLSAATAELDVAARYAAGLDEDLPRRGRTFVLRARLAGAKGDDTGVRAAREGIDELTTQGLDRSHPLVLAAAYEEATRMVGRSEQRAALTQILDQSLLEHGRPALGDGHPLLLAARDLAARSGTQQGSGDEDLPWDVSADHQ